MAKKSKENRYIHLLLVFAVLGLSIALPALADECPPSAVPVSTSIGARCTEDPSCVIVGETHMLEWKSPAPAKLVVVCIHGLDGKAEHLVLEEARFSRHLVEKLIGWMKNDANSKVRPAVIEVVDDEALSSKESRRLSVLRKLAKQGMY